MKILPGNAQDIGNRREQQDSFGFSDIDDAHFVKHGGVIAVLSDGMGGMEMGREAGLAAVSTVLSEYGRKTPDQSIPAALENALRQANRAVFDLCGREERSSGPGATLCATVIHEDRLYWVSAGDSRIYRYRNGELLLLTQDHVYAKYLEKEVARGMIRRETAENHPEKDALTSFLGMREIGEIDWNAEPMPLFAGDRILLCSDGLYRVLPEKRIIRALAGDPQQAAETLVAETLAQKQPHQDNVTVAILALESETPDTRKSGIGFKAILALVFMAILAGIGWWAFDRLNRPEPPKRETVEVVAPADTTTDEKHLPKPEKADKIETQAQPSAGKKWCCP